MKRVYKLSEFDSCDVISLDFETKSFTDLDVICYSVAGYVGEKKDENIIYAIFNVLKDAKSMPNLLDYLPKRRVTFHNFKFDGKVLHHYGFKFSSFRYEDTILMARLLFDTLSMGLKELTQEFFNYSMSHFDEVLSDDYKHGRRISEFEKYAGDDAIYTLKLFKMLRNKIIEEDLVTAYMLELKTVVPVMMMELNGIKFDVERCDELKKLTKNRIMDIEDSIYEQASRQVQMSVPSDLCRFLYDEMQIPYLPEYSKGMKTQTRSVRSEVLEEIKENLKGDPREKAVSDIIEWKKLNKLLTSFFDGQKEAALSHPDRRVRSNFNQVAVVTGRFSSEDPNMQQLPTTFLVKDDPTTSIRAMFVAEEGNKLIDVDYSQIELRLLAHFSGDSTMVNGFINGEDFHQKTVDMAGGNITRREAKMANFGRLYGMSPYGFAMQAKISTEEAYRYYQTYDKVYPGVPRMKDDVKKFIVRNGYIRLIGGRKRRFPDGTEEGIIERMGVNSLIQGSAAVVLKLALINLFNHFLNRDCKMVCMIHDEILFEVPEDKADKYAEEIKGIMENCIKLKVPLIVEPKIIDHFGEAKA